MPPISVATCWPGGNSPFGQAATVPTASIPSTRGNVTATGKAQTGVQLGTVQPERGDLDQHLSRPWCGDGDVADVERVRWCRCVEHDRPHCRLINVEVREYDLVPMRLTVTSDHSA